MNYELTKQEIDRVIEEFSSEIAKSPYSTCFVTKDDLEAAVYLLNSFAGMLNGLEVDGI
jgi:hypothetical protein